MEFNPEDDVPDPLDSPKVSLNELRTTLQILMARTAQTTEVFNQPYSIDKLESYIRVLCANQVAIMGACAALLVNVIDTKKSFGET